MSRIARVVIPGLPHHVVQRGNRRQTVFFCDEDRHFYLWLLKKYGEQEGVDFWAYCLMSNHVHLIAVPETEKSLSEVMARVNWKYALSVNLKHDWQGCLWQGRYYSCPLDPPHLIGSARYIERNPVRAGITIRPEDYPWSSAKAHIQNVPDELIKTSSLTVEIKDWAGFIHQEEDPEMLNLLRRHLVTGRPLGDDQFIDQLEKITGRTLKKQKPGPKKKQESQEVSRPIDILEISD